MNRLLKRLGLKDEYGYCDTSIVGFLTLWSAYGYGTYIVITELWNNFT